jgi:hypothetical protein
MTPRTRSPSPETCARSHDHPHRTTSLADHLRRRRRPPPPSNPRLLPRVSSYRGRIPRSPPRTGEKRRGWRHPTTSRHRCAATGRQGRPQHRGHRRPSILRPPPPRHHTGGRKSTAAAPPSREAGSRHRCIEERTQPPSPPRHEGSPPPRPAAFARRHRRWRPEELGFLGREGRERGLL